MHAAQQDAQVGGMSGLMLVGRSSSMVIGTTMMTGKLDKDPLASNTTTTTTTTSTTSGRGDPRTIMPKNRSSDHHHDANNNHRRQKKEVSSSLPPGGGGGAAAARRNTTTTTTSRTVMLRVLLIASLMAAVAICATLSYFILQRTEQEVGIQTYQSIAASALAGARAITLRKVQGSHVMATVLSHMLPDASMWPLISIEGYIPIAQRVAELSSSMTLALMIFVNPSEASTFEEHTKMEYELQGRPPAAGVSDFGLGIWKTDKENSPHDDGRVHDVSGQNDWGGTREILAPLTMHNKVSPSSLLLNLYSRKDRGRHIDSMLDCVEKSIAENATRTPECVAMTDVLELTIRPGQPAGLLFEPIFPAHDPTNFVGFATTTIHWETVLQSIVPDYVDGLLCVLETDTGKKYTYKITNGVPTLMGPGDLHDPAYGAYAESIVLNDFLKTGATSSAVYTLTVYPTQVIFNEFRTNSPLAVALGFCAVIAAVAFIFFSYDYLMRHEAHERRMVLEVKRKFVRFISHEIRTPLNTVCMGLELLESELHVGKKSNKGMEEDEVSPEDVDFWHNITVDVRENAQVAVLILNDLLNYDKLETGTFKLEVGNVPIWELIEQTINQFRIQAANKRVSLDLTMEPPVGIDGDNDDFDDDYGDVEEAAGAAERLIVRGDDVRLSQVIRNVVSNALKFTPADGTIDVAVSQVPNGLSKVDAGCGDLACGYPRAGSIRISVKDSGVGLTKEQLALLFGEGIQFDANRLQHGGGSGLGLSIAKGLVEQHDGIIWAESEGTGMGTTFVIELPLYNVPSEELTADGEVEGDDDDKAAESRAPTESFTDVSSNESDDNGNGPGGFSFHPRRILVAEDAASSRKMLIRLLERAGHACTPAANGQEAVDAVEEDLKAWSNNSNHVPFDSILMDFEMPLLRGPEATKMIREMGFKGTIIGVTGNVLSEDVEFFKRHGADEVLPKPVSMDRIRGYWEASASSTKSHHHHNSHRRSTKSIVVRPGIQQTTNKANSSSSSSQGA